MPPGIRIGLCIALSMSSAAAASEAAVKQAMQKRYPAIQVESVADLPRDLRTIGYLRKAPGLVES